MNVNEHFSTFLPHNFTVQIFSMGHTCWLSIKFQEQLGPCYKAEWLVWALLSVTLFKLISQSSGVILPSSSISFTLPYLHCLGLSPSLPSSISLSIHLPLVCKCLAPPVSLSLSESCISKSWFSSRMHQHTTTASLPSHTEKCAHTD